MLDISDVLEILKASVEDCDWGFPHPFPSNTESVPSDTESAPSDAEPAPLKKDVEAKENRN